MDNIINEDVKAVSDYLGKDAMKLEGKSILVTGGAGFLCSYFLDVVAYLNDNVFKKSCRIICLDNLKTGKSKNIQHLESKEYFKHINHDITKPLKIDGSVDFIIHGASIASPTFYRQFPFETMDVNVMGTRNMLDLAKEKKVQSFLFLSTSEVYGDPDPKFIPTKETYFGNASSIGPRACYDESKRFGETLCMNYFWKFGVPVKISRTFNTFGPRLSLDDKRVIPDFLKNAFDDSPITILSRGDDTRSFCYVSDNVTAHMKVLLSDFNGEVFNIGNSNEEISTFKLAEKVKEAFGSNVKIVKKTSEDKNYITDNPKRRCPDISKIKEKLGWTPKINLLEGLKRTIEWHRANLK